MIPEHLRLTNFLSHRKTELDLRGLHLAVLVGDNGAGKSAILDAITWAVWGKARTASDDHLITHGETITSVEYVFRMPYQDGSERRFRILRQRKRTGRGSATLLDFQEESNGAWSPLNAGSIRATQAAIIKQLRLEYDTFINSAYLRQGHADEFTSRRPAERKRLLADILGLEQWDRYLERTKMRLSEAGLQLEQVERRIGEIRAELDRRPEYERALQEAEAKVAQATRLRQDLETRLATLERVEEQVLALRRRLREMERSRKEETQRLQENLRQIADKRLQVENYRRLLQRETEITARWADYRAAQEEAQRWNDKLQAVSRYLQEKARLQAAIESAADALRSEIRRLEQERARQEEQIRREEARLREERLRLEAEARRHEQEIVEARAELERRSSALRAEMETLRRALPDAGLESRLREEETRLAELEEKAQALAEARQALQEALGEESRLETELRQLEEACLELEEARSQLSAAQAECPLCHQPLTEAHRRRILEEHEQRAAQLREEAGRLRQRLAALQAEKGRLQSLIRTHEWALRRRPALEQEVARLRQQLERRMELEAQLAELAPSLAEVETQLERGDFAAEARAEAERLRAEAEALRQRLERGDFAAEVRAEAERLRAEAEALRQRLERGDFAAEIRAELEAVVAEMRAVGYDEAAHRALQERLAALAAVEAEYRALEAARVGLREAEETLAHLRAEEEERRTRLQTLESEMRAVQEQVETLLPHLRERGALEARRDAARDEEAQARQALAAARQHLAALETLRSRLIRLEEERDGLARRKGRLAELRLAFGVNGIPAMIIEHTLPQLEAEANDILTRLSGGRMHIRFETQRLTKKGTSRETLDIIISDEEGERPYENFSGGERFRVDFAVRVALSRLLANRAGVQLRSLFIDEGFGTLDADGRRRLIEAVKAVQEDFDLILVVTHIAEMQDAFPVRIRVSRPSAGGSQVWMGT